MARRYPSLLARAILRIVAIAIALVVGSATPASPVLRAIGPVVCSADQAATVDALRAGERLEPRVAPAPWIDRTARIPALLIEDAPAGARRSSVVGALPQASQARDQRRIVLQRIPRLESGDPPRA